MEHRNQTIIIGLLALIAGLLVGYFLGGNTMPYNSVFSNAPTYEEMEQHRDDRLGGHTHDDEIVAGDGELQHMMDEMMLIGRGKTGDAYEEAWLRGMVVHHLGAINMAEELTEKSDRPELIEFANTIINDQSEEVEQMKGWLNEWYNEN